MSSLPNSTFTQVPENGTLAQINYPPHFTPMNIVVLVVSACAILATFLGAIRLQRSTGKTIFIPDNAHPEYPNLRTDAEEAEIELREQRGAAKPVPIFRYGPGMTDVEMIPPQGVHVDKKFSISGASDEFEPRYPGFDKDEYHYNLHDRPARSIDSNFAVSDASSDSRPTIGRASPRSLGSSTHYSSYDEDEYHNNIRERELARKRNQHGKAERFFGAPKPPQGPPASLADTECTYVHGDTAWDGWDGPVTLDFGEDKYAPSYVPSAFVPRKGLDDY